MKIKLTTTVGRNSHHANKHLVTDKKKKARFSEEIGCFGRLLRTDHMATVLWVVAFWPVLTTSTSEKHTNKDALKERKVTLGLC